MKLRLAFFAAALLTGGCGLGQDAMVLLTDPAWEASLLARSGEGFDAPDGLAWSKGRLLIADEGGATVRAWSGKNRSAVVADAKAGLASPEDLAVDGNGTIFVTDDEAGGVRGVAADGRAFILAGPDQGLGPTEGIAFAPSGALLVGEPGRDRVASVGRDGQVRSFLTGVGKAESMAFDGRGNLYIADNESDILYLRTPDGRLHRPVTNREGFSPESLWHSDGRIYITDSANGKLHVYTPEDGLATIAVLGGDLAQVQGVTTDPSGAIYLSIQADLKRKRGFVLRLRRRS